MRSMTSKFAGVLALLLGSATIAAAQSPVGIWLDDSGEGAVEIRECGDGKLCGKLVWLKDPENSKACGTAIIGDAAKTGDSWDGGWIYSPEKKSKYDVELTPDGQDKLTVLGYAGTKLFSREMTWTRAPADLKRCDVQEANSAPTAASPPGKAPAAAEAASDKAAGAATEAVAPPAKDVQTAQAGDTKPQAKRAAPRKAERKKTRMCRVDAPFVRVEFPCDDD
jgi:uncharacterized protein (DUF2147 family)